MAGAETNLRMSYLARTEGAFNAGPLIVLAGGLIVAAAIVASGWSPWGILIAGAVSILVGVLQYALPLTMNGSTFSIARTMSDIAGLVGVEGIEEAVLGFLLDGGAVPFGVVLIGAGLARRAAPTSSVLWLSIAVVGPILGVIVLIFSQGVLVQAMRVMAFDPSFIPGVVIGSVALGAAAYASRGAPFGLLAVAVPIAGLGLLVVALPELVYSAYSSLPVPLTIHQGHIVTQGYVLLNGVMLIAGSVAALLRTRTVDAALAPAV